jgi:RND family efflux transporter MFP subunit
VVLGWSSINAPSAGRIVERAVDPGSAIFPGSPLLVLESLTSSQVRADVPSAQSGKLKHGMTVRVLYESDVPVEGRVVEIVPVSSTASHTVRFKVDLPASVRATSGGFARVFIPTGERQALLVPKSAVRATGQLTGIFIADSGSKARLRLIKTAPFDDERVEVLSGLESGERAVLNPDAQIVDGVPLEIRS